MVNKLNPKSIPIHTRAHKEYYEPKLQMMICGCGNRRELTVDEKLQHGLVAQITANEIQTEIRIFLQNQIPKRS